MKVIVSHDVDSITVTEHCGNLIVPKYLVRSMIEAALGYASPRELAGRLSSLWRNKWHCIDEVMLYDRARGIPSTFFVAVSNGCNLCYSLERAREWICRIIDGGFDVGVHGIEYVSPDGIRHEHDLFREIAKFSSFGVRMHYLRMTDSTAANLAAAGYEFDSSVRGLGGPYRLHCMWEFPLHVMDCDLFNAGRRWQSRSLSEAKAEFEMVVRNAIDANVSYFTVLLHDHYFCPGYKAIADWYCWMIEYLGEIGCEFVSYRDAVAELNERADIQLIGG